MTLLAAVVLVALGVAEVMGVVMMHDLLVALYTLGAVQLTHCMVAVSR